MAVITNPQYNLPLGWSKPNVSLPEQTQDEAIAALADLILQVWEKNRQTDKPLGVIILKFNLLKSTR